MFRIEYAVPQGPLKQFVSMFYRFETDGAIPGDFERADIAHVRLNFGADSIIRFGEDEACAVSGTALIGPRNSYSFVESEGKHWVFGFGLMPAGWHALTKGANAHAYADKVVPAASLIGPLVDDVRAQVADGAELDIMVSRVAPMLEAACMQADNSIIWFVQAVEEWVRADLDPDFDDLLATTGLAHRKAETMLKEIFGAPPKLFIRKCKALRVANRIAHGEGDWQDYVGEGFYDQSHFIREIKHFTGTTPVAIREARSTMSQVHFQRRRKLATGTAGDDPCN